jgi:hypothetical protein
MSGGARLRNIIDVALEHVSKPVGLRAPVSARGFGRPLPMGSASACGDCAEDCACKAGSSQRVNGGSLSSASAGGARRWAEARPAFARRADAELPTGMATRLRMSPRLGWVQGFPRANWHGWPAHTDPSKTPRDLGQGNDSINGPILDPCKEKGDLWQQHSDCVKDAYATFDDDVSQCIEGTRKFWNLNPFTTDCDLMPGEPGAQRDIFVQRCKAMMDCCRDPTNTGCEPGFKLRQNILDCDANEKWKGWENYLPCLLRPSAGGGPGPDRPMGNDGLSSCDKSKCSDGFNECGHTCVQFPLGGSLWTKCQECCEGHMKRCQDLCISFPPIYPECGCGNTHQPPGCGS